MFDISFNIFSVHDSGCEIHSEWIVATLNNERIQNYKNTVKYPSFAARKQLPLYIKMNKESIQTVTNLHNNYFF